MESTATVKQKSAKRVDLDALPGASFIPVPAIADVLGVSVPTVWRWVHDGRLPPLTKLGPGTTRMNVGVLRCHLAKAVA